MTKELSVLAECVDVRSGRRFRHGETFDPPPTVEQARRLIAAGCLSKDAESVAAKAEAQAEKKAAADQAARGKQAEEARKLIEARNAKDVADQAVDDAKAALENAVAADEKAAAEAALTAANKAAKVASDELAKLAD